jgi:hypothetical protein
MKTFLTTLGVILAVAFVLGALQGGGFGGGYFVGFVFFPALIVAGVVAFLNRDSK